MAGSPGAISFPGLTRRSPAPAAAQGSPSFRQNQVPCPAQTGPRHKGSEHSVGALPRGGHDAPRYLQSTSSVGASKVGRLVRGPVPRPKPTVRNLGRASNRFLLGPRFPPGRAPVRSWTSVCAPRVREAESPDSRVSWGRNLKTRGGGGTRFPGVRYTHRPSGPPSTTRGGPTPVIPRRFLKAESFRFYRKHQRWQKPVGALPTSPDPNLGPWNSTDPGWAASTDVASKRP